MNLFKNGRIFRELPYEKEEEIEREVVKLAKLLFGEKSLYIDVKKKIETKALGNTIPDGFLFDFSNPDFPAFYLVEVELAKHDFYRHIFPQITKFFGFYKNSKSQSELIEKIHSIIMEDSYLNSEFLRLIQNKEPYKTIKDIIDDSQNILIVIDGEKKELPEIIDVYVDTWGKMVKTIIFNRFEYNQELIYTVHPEFNDIEYSNLEYIDTEVEPVAELTEEYHLEGVKEVVRNIFHTIKESLLAYDNDVFYNIKKYYISIGYAHNVAFIVPRKSKLRIVVKESLEHVQSLITQHQINSLSESVQRFWGGPSCEILIETTDNLQEIIQLLKSLIQKDKQGDEG